MRIIIIEDEKITAKDLKNTLLGINSTIEVIATLHSVAESLSYFATNRDYDLIFQIFN